jgi:hypothetical protein
LDFIAHLDYRRILDELELFKNEKFYYNISLTDSGIREVLSADGWYSLVIPKSHITPDSMEKLSLLTDFAVMVLKSYVEKFYKYEKDRWEAPLLEYQELSESDGNFVDEYKFSYYDSYDGDTTANTVEQFVEDLKTLLNQHSGIPNYEKGTLNNALVAFDFRAHLYTPLICLQAGGLKLTVSPVSLNDDEKNFVDKLKAYVDTNGLVFDGKHLYLLRNKSKVGMGFFEAGNFYPDYVLWLDTPDVQYISFIDPKGLHHLQWTDPKIEFSTTIKDLERRIQPTSGKKIVLNSFIMSGTCSTDLGLWWSKNKSERHSKNVFCLDESDCIEGMFSKIV